MENKQLSIGEIKDNLLNNNYVLPSEKIKLLTATKDNLEIVINKVAHSYANRILAENKNLVDDWMEESFINNVIYGE